MSVLPTCLCLYHSHAMRVSGFCRSRQGHQIPLGLEVQTAVNLGPWQVQQVILTPEPTLRPRVSGSNLFGCQLQGAHLQVVSV